MYRVIPTFICIIVFLLSGIIYPQYTQEWVERYNGPGNGIDLALSIAVDSQGNVVVTGNSPGTSSDNDLTTIKYNAAGEQQWIQRYNGPANAGDGTNGTNAIAVDGLGNIYVTGWSEGTEGWIDFVTIKYNSNGVEQWAQRYNAPGNNYDAPSGIALDPSNNVYVTGRGEEIGTGSDYLTIKYNSDGVQQWIQTFNGTANSYDGANAIAVDAGGNAYITGYVSNTGSGDCVTIKYNTDGVQQWVEAYDGVAGEGDYGNAITVDASGNVYVAGSSSGSSTGNDFLTLMYNPAGEQQWAMSYSSFGAYIDEARSIALDNSGNVYITGVLRYSEGGTSDNFSTIKYNSTGTELWAQVYDGPNGVADEPFSIAVDSYGNSYVIGYIDGTQNQNLGIVKYNTDGLQQWVEIYDGPAAEGDTGYDIMLDADGNFYASGGSIGIGSTMDYVIMKYSQIIPVELTSFTADIRDGKVVLHWQTATEKNNAGFDVERLTTSIDGFAGVFPKNWEDIGFIPGNGTTTNPQEYSYTDNNIAAGSYLYRLKQIDFDGSFEYSNEVEVNIDIPAAFSLAQNYPNPFNPATTINYQIPQTGFVTLKIYDMLGKEVATLVNEQKNQGRYTISFDASKLASGIYIYKLRFNDYVSSMKMLLLK